MSTRKIVPNGDNEGGLGTADKRFASIYVTAPETGANDSRAVNAKWVQALVASMDAKYLISETEPSNPNDGSLWFDTGNMLIKARINGAWVSFGAVYSG